MTEARQVLHIQNILGEGPVWVPEINVLYWVDIDGKLLLRFRPGAGEFDGINLGLKIGSFCVREDGGFVLATDRGLLTWDPVNEVLTPLANPEQGKPEARFNDGKVDRKGRFWTGTMTPSGATSRLYRLDPNFALYAMITDVTISNGIGWSPDNSTMYFADTGRQTIFAFDFDLENGLIANKRSFFEIPRYEGCPDGLTVDSQGFIWCALWDGWKVIRISSGGQLDGEIHLPVARPTSCAFGGEGLDTLYITSASVGYTGQMRREQPMAGDLFAYEPGVTGLPEPKFAG